MKLSSLRTKSGERVWPEKHGIMPASNLRDTYVCIKCNETLKDRENACKHNEALSAADLEVVVDTEALAKIIEDNNGFRLSQETKDALAASLHSWLRAKGGE